MKLRAEIQPKYFDEIKAGKKKIDYRQMESITLVNTETGEEIILGIRFILCRPDWAFEEIQKQHPDINFTNTLPIHAIFLGEIKKPEENEKREVVE